MLLERHQGFPMELREHLRRSYKDQPQVSALRSLANTVVNALRSLTQPCMAAYCTTVSLRPGQVSGLCNPVHPWQLVPEIQSIKRTMWS